MSATEDLQKLCSDEDVDLQAVIRTARAGADLSATMWSPNILFADHVPPLTALMPRRRPDPTPELVHALVDLGADPDQASPKRGFTALQLAASYNHTEVCRALLDRGADVNAVSDRPECATALAACINQRAEMCLPTVELLLERGAEVDLADLYGHTPVFRAIKARNRPVLEALLAAGADLRTVFAGEVACGQHALAYAAVYWPEVIGRLVEAGADPNLPIRGGGLGFWRPVFDGELGTVDRLLAVGADLNHRDDRGRTVLLEFVDWPRRCDPSMVRALLARGADPNLADDDGRTPLHAGAQRQEVEVVEALLSHGALQAPDGEGRLPRDLTTRPLIAAALGDPSPLDPDDVLGMAVAFLRDGLELRHGEWRWWADDGRLREHLPDWRRSRWATETHAREVFGWVLLHREPAFDALVDLVNRGRTRLALPELPADALRTHWLQTDPDLVSRLELPVEPRHGGEVMAAAMEAGWSMSHGDKEGHWSWTWSDDTFAFQAGEHLGPEQDQHTETDRAGFIARWSSGTLEHGRLEGFDRSWIDRALEHLGVASVRTWLDSAP